MWADTKNTSHIRQHRTIPALRLKHRSGSCRTASALPKCSIMSGCGTRIVLRGQKLLALCDRCPCFGSLFPPLAALTFAASSIICAFGLASVAPRSPYRHLELCGIALTFPQPCLGQARRIVLMIRLYHIIPAKNMPRMTTFARLSAALFAQLAFTLTSPHKRAVTRSLQRSRWAACSGCCWKHCSACSSRSSA